MATRPNAALRILATCLEAVVPKQFEEKARAIVLDFVSKYPVALTEESPAAYALASAIAKALAQAAHDARR